MNWNTFTVYRPLLDGLTVAQAAKFVNFIKGVRHV